MLQSNLIRRYIEKNTRQKATSICNNTKIINSINKYLNSEECEVRRAIRPRVYRINGITPVENEPYDTEYQEEHSEIEPNDISDNSDTNDTDNGENMIKPPPDITEIRQFLEYEDGYELVKNKEITQKDIAAEFGVSTQRVSMLIRQIKLKRKKNNKN